MLFRSPLSHSPTHILSPCRKIAAGVILAWGRTIYKQFELLAGKSAPHDFLQLLIYKTMTFSEDIAQVDTVRAYHVRIRSSVKGIIVDLNAVLEWACMSHVVRTRISKLLTRFPM